MSHNHELNFTPNAGKGFIYILSNPSMPNVYKVGLTTNSIKQRIRELNTTGVPQSFILVKKYEVSVNRLMQIERLSHKKLKRQELHHGKEFFIGDLSAIVRAVEDAIHELTGEVAFELVGDAARRKADRERIEKEEREARDRKLLANKIHRSRVHERLILENNKINQLRISYINQEKSEDGNFSFLDKFIFIPLGGLFCVFMAISIVAEFPVMLLVFIVGGWWFYKSKNGKRNLIISDSAQKKYPYLKFGEVEKIINLEDREIHQ